MQDLPKKRFEIIVLKILRELQENTDRIFNEIRGKIQELSGKFNREVENIKRQPNINFEGKEYND